MTTLPNFGLPLPTRGVPGKGAWGDVLDQWLAKIDIHDHTSTRGVKIPMAGLNIDTDMSFLGTRAPVNLHRVQFSNVTALSDGAQNDSLFVSAADHELYHRNHSGHNIQLTSGNSLNVSAFIGGILGDYSSVGAQLTYDESTKRYVFSESTADSHHFARAQMGGIRISEFGTLTPSRYVGLLCPTAIAAQYDITLPAALPAATAPAMVNAAGAMSYQAVGPLVLPASAGNTPTGSSAVLAVGSFHWTCGSASDVVVFPVSLLPGVVIASVDIWYLRASGTLTFDLRKQVFSSGTTSSVASTTVNSGTSIAMATIASINHTVTSTDQYLLQFTPGGGVSDLLIAAIVRWAYA